MAWISDEMAEMAQYRMYVSAGGRHEDDEGGAWEGVRLACKDPFTWIYCVLHFGLILALSYKDFFPSVSLRTSTHSPKSYLLTVTDRGNARLRKTHDVSDSGAPLRTYFLSEV